MLTAEQILGAELHRVKVSVPEWGRMAETNGESHVWVRELAGSEIGELALVQDDGGDSEVRALARFCILGICDTGGNRLFTPANEVELMRGPLAPLKRCAEEFVRINGLSETEEAVLGK